MRIVIDTNIFCEDYFLRGTNFQLLFDGLKSLPASLHIPEVVVDEVVNRYSEDLAEVIAKDKAHRSQVSRLLADSTQAAPLSINLKGEVDSYRKNLEAHLKTHGEIMSYPEISHKRVVERDLARRKPFKRDGSGYRDYLIWENVKSLLPWGTERVILITNNPKDFGEGPHIDPELQKDLTNPDHLKIFRSLREFNETFVIPRLKMLDGIKETIQADPSKIGLMSWLGDNLLDVVRDVGDLEYLIADFPPGVGSVCPIDLVAFDDLKINDVRELESGEKLLGLTVSAEIDFSIDIDWDDYLNHQEVRDWAGEYSEEFSFSFSRHVAFVTIEVELTVNLETQQVTSHELLSIDGGYGSFQFK